MLIAGALAQHGFNELAKNLEIIASFPRETALAGDIVFVESPIKYYLKIYDVDKDLELRP